MNKQTTLSVVAAIDKAEAEPASLSTARQRLVEAYARREEANSAFAEVTKQHSRVEGLIVNPKFFEDRIGQLEAQHAILIEQWSLTAGESAEPPKLPHTAEIDRLKAELHHASQIAAGAKAALVRMNDELSACQEDSVRAIEAIRSAADQVMVEVAEDIATMLAPMEERAAVLRSALKALQQHFMFEGARGRSAVGSLSNAISALVPRNHEPPPQIDKLMGKWSSLASRLFTEPQSQLEL